MMMNFGIALSAMVLSLSLSFSADSKSTESKTMYDFTVKNIDGQEVQLEQYKGNVCLVVNVASRCGLTPQYAGLESLYRKYKDKGFQILAFPANNFGAQEPGSNAEIKKFCSTHYQVTFPLFEKISVKGDDQAPLYAYLTKHPDEAVAGEVVWNFQKYLVSRDGKVLAKFHPRTAPEDKELISAIEEALSSSSEKP